jgi:hypothetical protein
MTQENTRDVQTHTVVITGIRLRFLELPWARTGDLSLQSMRMSVDMWDYLF